MNPFVLILAILGALWGLGIYLGYIHGVGKTFKKTPESVSAQSTRTKNQQHEAAQEARDRQQQLMDKLRDQSRN